MLNFLRSKLCLKKKNKRNHKVVVPADIPTAGRECSVPPYPHQLLVQLLVLTLVTPRSIGLRSRSASYQLGNGRKVSKPLGASVGLSLNEEKEIFFFPTKLTWLPEAILFLVLLIPVNIGIIGKPYDRGLKCDLPQNATHRGSCSPFGGEQEALLELWAVCKRESEQAGESQRVLDP